MANPLLGKFLRWDTSVPDSRDLRCVKPILESTEINFGVKMEAAADM